MNAAFEPSCALDSSLTVGHQGTLRQISLPCNDLGLNFVISQLGDVPWLLWRVLGKTTFLGRMKLVPKSMWTLRLVTQPP